MKSFTSLSRQHLPAFIQVHPFLLQKLRIIRTFLLLFLKNFLDDQATSIDDRRLFSFNASMLNSNLVHTVKSARSESFSRHRPSVPFVSILRSSCLTDEVVSKLILQKQEHLFVMIRHTNDKSFSSPFCFSKTHPTEQTNNTSPFLQYSAFFTKTMSFLSTVMIGCGSTTPYAVPFLT